MGIRINFPTGVYTSQVISYTSILGNIAKILPLIIGIVLLLTFLKKENKGKYSGFAGTIYDFFTFRTFCFKKVLEVIYLFTSLYYTVYGGLYLFVSPVIGLTYLIIYNLVLRMIFELLMLVYKMKENSDKLAEVLYDDFEDDMIYEMEMLPEELDVSEDVEEVLMVDEEVEVNDVGEKEEKKTSKRTKKSEE